MTNDTSEGPKPVWATAHIAGPHARTLAPGEPLHERLPHALESLLERGLATDDPEIAAAAAAAHAASEHEAAERNRPRPFGG